MSLKIVIDPGHGGSDRANRGSQGYIEADGVLEMALALEEALTEYDCDVLLTRDQDVGLGLIDRASFAVVNGADVFISLHTNAGGGSGPEVYHSIDLPKTRPIAASLSRAIAMEFGLKDRGPKIKESTRYLGEDYFTIIDYAQDYGIKNIFLIEPMFHDNKKEELLLLTKGTMERIAKAITTVLIRAYDLKMKAPTDIDKYHETVVLPLQRKVARLENLVNKIGQIIGDKEV